MPPQAPKGDVIYFRLLHRMIKVHFLTYHYQILQLSPQAPKGGCKLLTSPTTGD